MISMKRTIRTVHLAWLALALLILSFFVASTPLYFNNLQQVDGCTGCGHQKMTPEVQQALQERGWTSELYAAWFIGIEIVMVLVYASVSAVIIWHKSHEREALFAAFAMLAAGPGFANIPGELAFIHPAWLLPVTGVNFIGRTALFVFFFQFPGGNFAPRWVRWVALGWCLFIFFSIFFKEMTQIVFTALKGPTLFLLFLSTIVYSQIYRYIRVSTPYQRHQTKWIVLGFVTALFFGLVMMYILAPILGLILGPALGRAFSVTYWYIAWLFLPVSILIAILRSNLLEIDIIVRRSLIYSALSVSLALIYFGSVVILQDFFQALTGQVEPSSAAIVLSTLFIAALFVPLRRRIQDLIDRRFYRRKYNAELTLQSFSANLRNEVDLEQLREQLLGVVQETVQPESISLWIRDPRSQFSVK
jgi:hypothetical protein